MTQATQQGVVDVVKANTQIELVLGPDPDGYAKYTVVSEVRYRSVLSVSARFVATRSCMTQSCFSC